MAKSLKQAIWENRRFHKYERLLRRIRLRVFEYEDSGRLTKAERVIARIKTICGPMWKSEQGDKQPKRWTAYGGCGTHIC